MSNIRSNFELKARPRGQDKKSKIAIMCLFNFSLYPQSLMVKLNLIIRISRDTYFNASLCVCGYVTFTTTVNHYCVLTVCLVKDMF